MNIEKNWWVANVDGKIKISYLVELEPHEKISDVFYQLFAEKQYDSSPRTRHIKIEALVYHDGDGDIS